MIRGERNPCFGETVLEVFGVGDMISKLLEGKVKDEFLFRLRSIFFLKGDLATRIPRNASVDNGKLVVLSDPDVKLYNWDSFFFCLFEAMQRVKGLETSSMASYQDRISRFTLFENLFV